MPRETSKRKNRKELSTEAEHRGGRVRISDESPAMRAERRDPTLWPRMEANQRWEEPVSEAGG